MKIIHKLLVRDFIVLKQFAESDHRIQRRPELMAHRRKEKALRLVCILRFSQRAGELALCFIEIRHVDHSPEDISRLPLNHGGAGAFEVITPIEF